MASEESSKEGEQLQEQEQTKYPKRERERERRKCESYQPVNPPSLMLKECEKETEYKNLQ